MRKYVSVFVLCTLTLCTLIGCKKEEPETFLSDQARPTWTVPEQYDYSSSMTAVVKVDLMAQYPGKAADFVLDNNDLLAAFSGETCLGTASPQDDLFYLFITGPVTDNPSPITLRYYSAHYNNLFEAQDAFSFANDAHLDTVAEPFLPAFVEVK